MEENHTGEEKRDFPVSSSACRKILDNLEAGLKDGSCEVVGEILPEKVRNMVRQTETEMIILSLHYAGRALENEIAAEREMRREKWLEGRYAEEERERKREDAKLLALTGLGSFFLSGILVFLTLKIRGL